MLSSQRSLTDHFITKSITKAVPPSNLLWIPHYRSHDLSLNSTTKTFFKTIQVLRAKLSSSSLKIKISCPIFLNVSVFALNELLVLLKIFLKLQQNWKNKPVGTHPPSSKQTIIPSIKTVFSWRERATIPIVKQISMMCHPSTRSICDTYWVFLLLAHNSMVSWGC